MSNFRNIKDSEGNETTNWFADGTYTFEAYEPYSQEYLAGGWIIGYGGCGYYTKETCEENQGWCFQAEGDMVYSDTDLLIDYDCHGGSFTPAAGSGGNILFDNNDENLDGAVEGTSAVSREETEDEFWYKYTVTLPADISDGTYYFKRKNYSYPDVSAGIG